MSRGRERRRKQRRRKAKPTYVDIGLEELVAIVERTKDEPLSPEERLKLKAAVETLAFVLEEIRNKSASLARLRAILFGSTSEKTSKVFGEEAASAPRAEGAEGAGEKGPLAKRPGHGRNGAAALTGAHKIKVPHPSLHGGDHCPGCEKGRVYPLADPAVLVRITGSAPLTAAVYERDRLRCNLCGEVFTAPPPEGVGEEKYDATAKSMVGLLKYGAGLPFNRIEKLQQGMGIPLPATTQWELVRDAAADLRAAFEELIHQAAQGDVLHNDDTAMKILKLTRESRAAALADTESDERTGVFTSGIVSTVEGRRIALFFTGARHAGENLSEVLVRRTAELPPPIQMCDALSRNTADNTVLANCIAHGRRKFVEVAQNFPDECRRVLETLREVYRNDDLACGQKMTPEERLRFHQAESGPLMEELERWMRSQIDEHRVEPNSGLGEAIGYMRNHWEKLTLFLRVPGAPLDNNICERVLKKAILHRKNSLFYRSENGARVGDIFMSLIHTAELNGVEPFHYLVALQRHRDEAVDAPAEWMPWNYRDRLAARNAEAGPSP